MKIAAQKLWLMIKKNWKIISLVVGALITFLVFRKNVTSFAEDFMKIKNNHDEELKKIDLVREEERQLNEKNALLLEKTMKTIVEEYDNQKIELDNKKKKEIKKIVEETNDNPELLAEKLAKITGFKIIMPTD